MTTLMALYIKGVPSLDISSYIYNFILELAAEKILMYLLSLDFKCVDLA